MGVLFKGRTSGKRLRDMARQRAEIFQMLTDAICKHLKFEGPPVLSAIESDTIYVDEENFCHLVERVLNSPDFALYSWAQLAAGIYETIKGQRYRWRWPERNTPTKPFSPSRQTGFAPVDESSETIGKSDVI